MLRLSYKYVVNLIALCAFKLMVLISIECFMDSMSHKSVFELMINFEVFKILLNLIRCFENLIQNKSIKNL